MKKKNITGTERVYNYKLIIIITLQVTSIKQALGCYDLFHISSKMIAKHSNDIIVIQQNVFLIAPFFPDLWTFFSF